MYIKNTYVMCSEVDMAVDSLPRCWTAITMCVLEEFFLFASLADTSHGAAWSNPKWYTHIDATDINPNAPSYEYDFGMVAIDLRKTKSKKKKPKLKL